MRYLAICEDELLLGLTGGTSSGQDITFLTEDAKLRRRLARRGVRALSGDLEKAAVYRRAKLDEGAFVLVSLRSEEKLHRVLRTVREVAPEAPVLALTTSPEHLDDAALRAAFPDVEIHPLHEAFSEALEHELKAAANRQFVRRYVEDFQKAERVLLLLHDEPDPDGLASALALRAVLGRTRKTAHIGTFKPMTRPENATMAQLLDIGVRKLHPGDLGKYQRVAVLDTQPHVFADVLDHADLVVDHHPVRKGYTARFRDIRTGYGSTATILIEHLQAAGVSVSGRLATAMLYAIKADTVSLRRGTGHADVEAFSEMYRKADHAIIRKIEGAGMGLDHLEVLETAIGGYRLQKGFLYAHIGRVEREDYVPYLADLFLELRETRWVAVSGVLGSEFHLSLRNLGYQRSAGELVQELFGELGSAGGRRAAAKAVLPLATVQKQAGGFRDAEVADWAWRLLAGAVGNE